MSSSGSDCSQSTWSWRRPRLTRGTFRFDWRRGSWHRRCWWTHRRVGWNHGWVRISCRTIHVTHAHSWSSSLNWSMDTRHGIVTRVETRSIRSISSSCSSSMLCVCLMHWWDWRISIRHVTIDWIHVSAYGLNGSSSCCSRSCSWTRIWRHAKRSCQRIFFLLHQSLGLPSWSVLVVGMLLHMDCSQSLSFINEGSLVSFWEKLPFGSKSLADLRVMHLGIFLCHFPSLTSRPNHEGIHWSLHSVDILVVFVQRRTAWRRSMTRTVSWRTRTWTGMISWEEDSIEKSSEKDFQKRLKEILTVWRSSRPWSLMMRHSVSWVGSRRRSRRSHYWERSLRVMTVMMVVMMMCWECFDRVVMIQLRWRSMSCETKRIVCRVSIAV